LNGAGTFGTNLQDCVAGVAKITAAGQDPSTVCGGALTVNLQVLCLTVGGNPCTAAGIAKVDTTQQAAVIAACPNQISPAVGKFSSFYSLSYQSNDQQLNALLVLRPMLSQL